MNKSEFIAAVSTQSGLSKVDTAKALDSFQQVICQVLKNGDKLVLPGLGSFSVGNRSARSGRNPQTGEVIKIKASRVAKFRAGKSLKEAAQ